MKKALLALLPISFIARASEEVESFSDEVMEDFSSIPEKVSTDWREMVMNHWSSLSSMNKMIIAGAALLLVVWLISKLFSNKDSSCSCD